MTSNLKFQEWMLVSLQSVGLGVLPSDPLFWEQKHVGRGDSVSLWSPPSSQSHCHLATAAFASSSPNWLWPHAHPESVSALECWPEGTPGRQDSGKYVNERRNQGCGSEARRIIGLCVAEEETGSVGLRGTELVAWESAGSRQWGGLRWLRAARTFLDCYLISLSVCLDSLGKCKYLKGRMWIILLWGPDSS